MGPPIGTDVELGSLERVDPPLGSGGEGVVHSIKGQNDLVVKLYHESLHPDQEALRRLVQLPTAMAGEERELLLRSTAWPVNRVTVGRDPVGVLMPRIPSAFFVDIPIAGTVKRRELELNYLLDPVRSARFKIPVPDEVTRIALCAQYAEVVALLHRHNVVLGDISMRNWLWSVSPRPAVYLIDCDGFRVSGCAPVLPPKETGDWRDPVLLPGGTTTEVSDRFKLALAIFRILLGDQSRHIESDLLDASSELPVSLRPFFRASMGEPATRPTASDWVHALGGPVAARSSVPTPTTPRADASVRPVLKVGEAPQQPLTPADTGARVLLPTSPPGTRPKAPPVEPDRVRPMLKVHRGASTGEAQEGFEDDGATT